MKTKKGKLKKPWRMLVHGQPEVGKSTFAAQAENAIWICTEDGSDELDVERATLDSGADLSCLADVEVVLADLIEGDYGFEVLVIDTVDWLDNWVCKAVCEENGWTSIKDPGYGDGYTAANDRWLLLLNQFEKLQSVKGMKILFLGHSHVKKHTPPDGSSYDRYELKMNKGPAALLTEWCKTILYASFLIHTKSTDDKKKDKAVGQERVLHCRNSATALAKNRVGLPARMPLNMDSYKAVTEGLVAEPGEMAAQMLEGKREPEDIKKAVAWVESHKTPWMAVEALRKKLEKEPAKTS